MRNLISLALTVIGLALVKGYPFYQNSIPNGNRIPDCDGRIWPGVGHLARSGGGPRNPFGRDFDNAGTTWTVALCRMDSDGDGLTNGEELGDPNCVWTQSSSGALLEPLSHPGIVCENVKENQTDSNDTDTDGENPTDEFYYFPTAQWAHGMLMLVAWVVLAPIGILFSLCNKTKVPPPVKSWFKFHQAIMFTVLILTLIAFIVIVNDLGELDFDENHNAVGFTVVVFSLIQFFGGVFRIHHKPHNAPKSTVRLVWEYCHQWFGRTTLILAIAAAVLGLEILGLRLNATNVTDGIRYTIIAILIASSLAAIIYVLLFRRDEREHKHMKDPQGEKKEPKTVHEDVQAEGDVTKF